MSDTRPLSNLRHGHFLPGPMRDTTPEPWAQIEDRDSADIAAAADTTDLETPFLYLLHTSPGTRPLIGVTAAGARALAHELGGISHRLVASIEHRRDRTRITSYPYEGQPARVTEVAVNRYRDEPDAYTVIVEMGFTKNGSVLQVERTELVHELNSDGTWQKRDAYREIARSKAFRNGVLALVGHDAVLRFKHRWMHFPSRAGSLSPEIPAAAPSQASAGPATGDTPEHQPKPAPDAAPRRRRSKGEEVKPGPSAPEGTDKGDAPEAAPAGEPPPPPHPMDQPEATDRAQPGSEPAFANVE